MTCVDFKSDLDFQVTSLQNTMMVMVADAEENGDRTGHRVCIIPLVSRAPRLQESKILYYWETGKLA